MVKRVAIVLEYDGTNYCGWQTQNGFATVQQAVEDAVERVTGTRACVYGAGRTDAGVHALAQTAHFNTESRIPGSRFADALNANLPKDISVLCSADVAVNFHARFSAVGKHYRYLIYNARKRPALDRYRRFFIPVPLDVGKMREAAAHLTGKHDFSAFCASGSEVDNKVRQLWKTAVVCNPPYISVDVYGAGFLRHMVRIIVGTLVGVGIGKLHPSDALFALQSGDRTMAGITAPPHGLYMVRVYYPYNLSKEISAFKTIF